MWKDYCIGTANFISAVSPLLSAVMWQPMAAEIAGIKVSTSLRSFDVKRT